MSDLKKGDLAIIVGKSRQATSPRFNSDWPGRIVEILGPLRWDGTHHVEFVGPRPPSACPFANCFVGRERLKKISGPGVLSDDETRDERLAARADEIGPVLPEVLTR